MNKSKYIFCFMAAIFISNAAAQEFVNVYSFLSTLAHSEEKERKLLSLYYLEDIIDLYPTNNGKLEDNTIYSIYNILEYLLLEGTVSNSTTENQQNNYTDVRLLAVILLGRLNIMEARDLLIELLRYENNQLIIDAANKILYNN